MIVLLLNPPGLRASLRTPVESLVSELPLNLASLLGSLLAAGEEPVLCDLHRESVQCFGPRGHNRRIRATFYTNDHSPLATVRQACYRTQYLEFLKDRVTSRVRATGAGMVAVNADNAVFALTILRHLKQVFPNLHTVIGGHRASRFTPHFLEKPQVDFVVRGEGETTLVALVAALDRAVRPEGLPGLSYQSGSTPILSEHAPPENLPALPGPVYDLFDLDFYQEGGRGLPMLASRGCGGRCRFCGRGFPGPLRLRPPAIVVEELRGLLQRHDCRRFVFHDNDLLADPDYLRRLCGLLLTLPEPVSFTCLARPEWTDPSLYALLAAVGCTLLSFGVESASPRLLELCAKRLSVDAMTSAVRAARAAGLRTRASFIYGLPTETLRDLLATFRFLGEARPDLVGFNRFVLDACSEFHHHPERYYRQYLDTLVGVEPLGPGGFFEVGTRRALVGLLQFYSHLTSRGAS